MVILGVLASGSGTNLQSIIDAIESKKLSARINVVISDNPGAYALERAKRHGLKTEVVTKDEYPEKEAFDGKLVSILKENGVGLVILAGFMRLLSPLFVRAFPMKIMNIHPSLLPSFTGLDVQKKALDYGVKFSGCTVHFVDEGVDTGPIIIQAVLPVAANDTPETLKKRILGEEHRIYPQAIQLYSEGRLTVKGRRVTVKDGGGQEGTLENPPVCIFKDE
ncbi:MAG: phosphoribosylglycinamide formyltransferase [Deltaproteobacteria bacterium]|nr:phosphoribosylglycinamide formyltransferase [Deltaproteobacteria bacterium]